MRFGRRAAVHNNHERWLVSYADFITLLFAFFVVMFSSARIDKDKTVQLATAIETAFQQLGALPQGRGQSASAAPSTRTTASSAAADLSRAQPSSAASADTNRSKPDFTAIRDQLEKALAPEIMRREIAVRVQPEGLIISLREIGFFSSGSATIKPQAMTAVARIVDVLRAHNCAVRIEGHTDTVPVHNTQFDSNWELSTARATELVKILVQQYEIPPEKLSAAGYAEFHPVASNDTPVGQQMNRRVDFVVTAADMPPKALVVDPLSVRNNMIGSRAEGF